MPPVDADEADAEAVARRCVLAHAAIGAVVAVVVVLVGLLIGVGVWSIPVAVLLGGLVAWLLLRRADAMALAALGASPLEPGRRPKLENLVDGLVVSHGFHKPALYVVDDPVPNAASVGRTPQQGVLVVTTGLLDTLGRVELEGVLAHQLVRIRSRETFAAVTAANVVCRPLGFAPGLAASLSSKLVDPDAGIAADLAGASITRYPPGLASALATMRADGRTVRTNPRAYRHLWVDVPADPMVPQQFSLDERIDVLEEL